MNVSSGQFRFKGCILPLRVDTLSLSINGSLAKGHPAGPSRSSFFRLLLQHLFDKVQEQLLFFPFKPFFRIFETSLWNLCNSLPAPCCQINTTPMNRTQWHTPLSPNQFRTRSPFVRSRNSLGGGPSKAIMCSR